MKGLRVNYIFRLFILCLTIGVSMCMTACESDETFIEEIDEDNTMWVSLDGNAWFYGSYENLSKYNVMRIGEICIDSRWYTFCPDIMVANKVVRGVIFPDGISGVDMYRVNNGGIRIYSGQQEYDSFSETYSISVFFVPDNGYLKEDMIDTYIEFVALEDLEYGKKYTSEETSTYFVLDDYDSFTMYDGRVTITGQVVLKNRDVILKVSDEEVYVFVRELYDEGLFYAADRSSGDVFVSNYAGFYAD